MDCKYIVVQILDNGVPHGGTLCGHDTEEDAMADATGRAKQFYGKRFAIARVVQVAGPPEIEVVKVRKA